MLLTRQVLVLRDARVLLLHREINHGNGLVPFLLMGDMVKAQGAVGEFSKTIAEELVQGTGKDEAPEGYFVADLLKIRLQHNFDVRVVEHVLEHPSVTVLWHVLVLVVKVPIIPIGSSWQPRCDRLVKFGRVNAPLFAGVAAEELVIKFSADLADDDILRRLDVLHVLRARLEPLDKFLGR